MWPLLFLFLLHTHTKYKDLVFPEYTVTKDLTYNEGKLFDIYQPKGDSSDSRPLIIWMHGGGFKFGSKNAGGIRLWCKTFAQRGYVCAAINYRLGKKNLSFKYDDLVADCNNAVKDVQNAVTFFKQHAAQWDIDTSKIILAGNSAGGMLALQSAYSPKVGFKGIAAIVNFWGGIFDTSWLRNARVPIVSVHGERDRTVPYDNKGYPLYGSLPIHRMADALGIPNALKTYEGYAHELQKHFNPLIVNNETRKRWLQAGQFAADFLYTALER